MKRKEEEERQKHRINEERNEAREILLYLVPDISARPTDNWWRVRRRIPTCVSLCVCGRGQGEERGGEGTWEGKV